MIFNITILAANDMRVAFKNKTLYLVLFIPLFLFAALELIDAESTAVTTVRLGLITGEGYAPSMIASLKTEQSDVVLTWLPSRADGTQWLRDKRGDALLIGASGASDFHALIVLNEVSVATAAVLSSLAELQRRAEGRDGNWVAEVRSLQTGDVQKQMQPTWVLMLVLLVAFIVLPTQVAEEKEKQLLLGLLQAPVREVEWLLAKALYGVILTFAASLLLHLLTSFDLGLEHALKYFLLLSVGAFCFCSLGVLVGFLCRTQAAARTLGVLFYLPLLLPSALGDYSQSLSGVAPLIPSYQLYQPMRRLLLEDSGSSGLSVSVLTLLAIGLVTSVCTLLLMRKRWLM